ncbi:hypothetical protein VHEMI03433 [[Torrubiella] hemipterigena]|uniref:Cyclin N-terminal domain-containing protein n=1 Tax=[Torrubiella] hemipterigena TaxID=1531966 RepID=A0A0A1SSI1_9HYPO|nr:hypothetical protein VHEMI03433 [[Torrubiella] hemipterigena]
MKRQQQHQHDAAAAPASQAALDTAFFTYKPLSNLPTPPPSYRGSSGVASPLCNTAWDVGPELLSDHYRGSAIHLVNLIPSAASLADASVSLVQAILARANLPLETIALAVCILDSLNSRFARKWRLSCPLVPASPAVPSDSSFATSSSSSSKRHSLPQSSKAAARKLEKRNKQPQLHIDSVNPEIIVLAALVIAVKFTEDPEQASQFYCDDWGQGLWSSSQLNTTERCVIENLNYRIMPLCDEELIADAMADMQLAGAHATPYHLHEPTPPDSDGEEQSNDGYVLGHSRSKTMAPITSRYDDLGLGLGAGWAM